MQIRLSDTCADLIAQLRKQAHVFPEVARKAVIEATRVVFEEARTQLSQLIYNQAIPILRRFRRLKAEGGGWRSAGDAKGKQKKFFGHAHSAQQSNKAAWRRTSTLLRQERFYFRGKGGDTEGIIDNATPYANARHELDRPSPVDGKTRRAPWRKLAMEKAGPRAIDTFRYFLRLIDNGG